MYNLQLPDYDGPGIPLHEHSAFMLVTALLHDDLDDREDGLRGVLEIDPLLSLWAVLCASANGVSLTTWRSASRWLSSHGLAGIGELQPGFDAFPISPRARSAWRRTVVASIGAGRASRREVVVTIGGRSMDAFWLASLLCMKRQLDGFAGLNGHSPLHGVRFKWPRWIVELDERFGPEFHVEEHNTPSSGLGNSVHVAVRSALDADQSSLVSQEEQQLWFRPYPEFRQLAPLAARMLGRQKQLEERFEETLQREKLAAMQQLAYGASHEINNPLANISTRAQTLVYNEQDVERRKKLLAINDQAFRAYEMIADLMLFANPPGLNPQEVVLDTLLQQLRVELDPVAIEQGIQLQVSLDREPVHCIADPVQLSVAIKALCVNGFESMTDGGQLRIQLSREPGTHSAEISVEDSGHGLSAQARRHLFDPFYSGREAGRGLGFGLSKAWRIVEQHCGTIGVSSRPSCGSRFTVTLPLDGGRRRNGTHQDRSQADADEQHTANAELRG